MTTVTASSLMRLILIGQSKRWASKVHSNNFNTSSTVLTNTRLTLSGRDTCSITGRWFGSRSTENKSRTVLLSRYYSSPSQNNNTKTSKSSDSNSRGGNGKERTDDNNAAMGYYLGALAIVSVCLYIIMFIL